MIVYSSKLEAFSGSIFDKQRCEIRAKLAKHITLNQYESQTIGRIIQRAIDFIRATGYQSLKSHDVMITVAIVNSRDPSRFSVNIGVQGDGCPGLTEKQRDDAYKPLDWIFEKLDAFVMTFGVHSRKQSHFENHAIIIDYYLPRKMRIVDE